MNHARVIRRKSNIFILVFYFDQCFREKDTIGDKFEITVMSERRLRIRARLR